MSSGSLNKILQDSFVPITGSTQSSLGVTHLPLRANSIVDQRIVLAPTAGTVLAEILPADLVIGGYYALTVSLGCFKITGGGDPSFSDLGNFGSFVNGIGPIDTLISLGSGALTGLTAYFNVDFSSTFQIRTLVNGSAGVAYGASVIADRIL